MYVWQREACKRTNVNLSFFQQPRPLSFFLLALYWATRQVHCLSLHSSRIQRQQSVISWKCYREYNQRTGWTRAMLAHLHVCLTWLEHSTDPKHVKRGLFVPNKDVMWIKWNHYSWGGIWGRCNSSKRF